MRLVLLTLVGALCWLLSNGCSQANMTESDAEVRHHQRHILDVEGRELNEDLEYLLLLDRPSRLTRWEVE